MTWYFPKPSKIRFHRDTQKKKDLCGAVSNFSYSHHFAQLNHMSSSQRPSNTCWQARCQQSWTRTMSHMQRAFLIGQFWARLKGVGRSPDSFLLFTQSARQVGHVSQWHLSGIEMSVSLCVVFLSTFKQKPLFAF